jgi:hypothetical protein
MGEVVKKPDRCKTPIGQVQGCSEPDHFIRTETYETIASGEGVLSYPKRAGAPSSHIKLLL